MGRRIRALRARFGHKQHKMADNCAIKPQYLSRVEVGAQQPSPVFIRVLCWEYEVSERWMWTGLGDPRQPPEEAERLNRFSILKVCP